MKFHLNHIIAGFALTFVPFAAQAATVTANLAVSANVANICTVTASTLGFGSIGLTPTSDTVAQGDIKVTCTGGAASNITLSPGANSTLDTDRKLKSGTNTIGYQLFQDASRTVAWGNTAATGRTFTATGVEQTFPVYGRITRGTFAAGSYTDTVTITVTY